MEIQHGRLSGGGPAPSIDINILKAESKMTKKLIIISWDYATIKKKKNFEFI